MQIDKFEVRRFPNIAEVGLSEAAHRLRVCIVTEEIIGPVRNGGIASTYYHLAKGLAANGHEVHVLFLKGPVVQDETPEHWVEHFAGFGVTLHYLQFPERLCWGASTNWQERYAGAYHWLRDREPFDVVHTSEWRGGMIYALMAKRLGLAFPETLFLVKTSSPHIWNRHYQMQPIERHELVLAAYAEQKCVELADMVIGGSAHLITFMDEIGYRVPEANVFVQPNIVDFSNVPVTDQRPPRNPGDIVRTKELVFFGRLEGRKGVELFCNALDILGERGVAPEAVTFMGKWGMALAAQGDVKVEDYLRAKIAAWPFPVEIVTDRNQPEALSYMCSRDMIAVMPSLIENSTMAVYETLEKRIPFIATAVGGTPELIDPQDHDACLVAPKAQALADRLEAALAEGQVIARSSFSNDENLRVWYGFHAHVGDMVDRLGRKEAIARLTAGADPAGAEVATISHAVLIRRGEALDGLVAALKADRPDRALLAFNDATMRPAVNGAAAALGDAGVATEVVDCIGQTAGDALNAVAAAQGADAMVIAHGVAATPRPGFFAAARAALAHRPDCLFTTFFTDEDNVLGMPIGGDVATQFLSSRAYGPELFAMRRATYERLGPFEPYDVRAGVLHEYVTRAAEAGPDDLLVCPEELIDWRGAAEEVEIFRRGKVYAYLKAKPLIDKSSLAQRKILLATLIPSGSAAAGKRAEERQRLVQRSGALLEELAAAPVEPGGDLRAALAPPAQGGGWGEKDWLQGWAWDRDDPDRALHVAAMRDGAPVFMVRADMQRAALGKATPGLEAHGFRIPVTPDLLDPEKGPISLVIWENRDEIRNGWLRRRAGDEPMLEVSDEPSPKEQTARREAMARSDALLAEKKDEKPGAGDEIRSGLTRPKSPADWGAGGWLTGWAWDRAAPDRVLHIVVMRRGQPLFMTRADERNPTLGKGAPGLEAHGFRIPVLPEFLDAAEGPIVIRVWETRARVHGGRMQSDGGEPPALASIKPKKAPD